ncbi:MAG: S1/P1 Nuclease [Bacteroidia bacterium]|nr:S1/P1 Nuclease [Bacteroidia bacterium]NNC86111.1 S1/P1 Nuclease [Bacteroidia bacterium]NNM15778.1 S1/P1 Nuclease [Bacteroidia bacterium]
MHHIKSSLFKKFSFLFVCILAFNLIHSILLFGWGFTAHKHINHMAVFTLPPEMIGFYKRNIDFITEHAVDPDKRRYAVAQEAARHYIDIDHYGENPFDSVPKYWKDAVEKYSEDTLQAYGIVPWHIDVMVRRLSEAMRNNDYYKILQVSADLGHYIGDAHVPLHCTKNYNGQLTNQKGIHGFWESRLPELFMKNYDFYTGRAVFVDDPLEAAWSYCKASFAAVDSVLLFEAKLNSEFPSDQKFSFEDRGATTRQNYSEKYSAEYHLQLDGMVERRMRNSIIAVGSLWYTAWVNAGQPNLELLNNRELTKELQKKYAEEDKMWKSGKQKNIEFKGHTD